MASRINTRFRVATHHSPLTTHPMLLFDTHAHLTDDRFRDDLPAVLDRAAAAGVTHVICVATTAADSPYCVRVAGERPLVWASVGIQPNHVAEAGPDDWSVVDRLADGLSSVYTFFEPGIRGTSYATYNVLWQIQRCHELQLAYLYLGYWIEQSRKMAYKASFRPIEGLVEGVWRRL